MTPVAPGPTVEDVALEVLFSASLAVRVSAGLGAPRAGAGDRAGSAASEGGFPRRPPPTRFWICSGSVVVVSS